MVGVGKLGVNWANVCGVLWWGKWARQEMQVCVGAVCGKSQCAVAHVQGGGGGTQPVCWHVGEGNGMWGQVWQWYGGR